MVVVKVPAVVIASMQNITNTISEEGWYTQAMLLFFSLHTCKIIVQRNTHKSTISNDK